MSYDRSGGALAGLDGAALLALLNEAHRLTAEQLAEAHGVTDQAAVDRLAAQPDKAAMLDRLAEMKAEAEYQHFYPSGPAAAEPEGEYEQFFPTSDKGA